MTAEDRSLYAPLYTEFKSYLSGMTMERMENGLHICHVRVDAIKDQKFTPDSQGCLSLGFDQVLDFIGNIAITAPVETKDTHGKYTIEYTI